MELDFNYSSVASFVTAAEKAGVPISALILKQQAEQMELPEEEVYEHMRANYQVMRECIEPGCHKDLRSTSGLTGGSAHKMQQVSLAGKSLTGPLLSGALYRALAVSELNASMGALWPPPQPEAAVSSPQPFSLWRRTAIVLSATVLWLSSPPRL